jgi:HEAT repeat protein
MNDEIRYAVDRLTRIDRGHPDEAVEAAEALAALGPEALCAVLERPEALNVPRGRRAISAALAAQDPSAVSAALIKALDSTDWRPVQVATDAIGLMAEAMSPVLVASMTPEANAWGLLNTITAVRRMGLEEAGPALRTLARGHADERVRAAAVESLGWMGTGRAAAALADALRDASTGVRLKAVKSAGWLRTCEVVDEVIAFGREADAAGRAVAVYALDRIGEVKATPFVIECLGDADAYVRWSAAVALRRLWTPDCADALQRATADTEETVAGAARETLSLR